MVYKEFIVIIMTGQNNLSLL